MLTGIVAALEGPPSVGKTTLARGLEAEGKPVVHSEAVYSGGPPYPAPLERHSPEEVDLIASFFVKVDEARRPDIEAAIKREGYAVLDRAGGLTQVAVEAASRAHNATDPEIFTSAARVAEIFQAAADEGRIILPTDYFIVEAPIDTIISNQQARGDQPGPLRSRKGLEAMLATYEDFAVQFPANTDILPTNIVGDKKADLRREQMLLMAQIEQKRRELAEGRKTSTPSLTDFVYQSMLGAIPGLVESNLLISRLDTGDWDATQIVFEALRQYTGDAIAASIMTQTGVELKGVIEDLTKRYDYFMEKGFKTIPSAILSCSYFGDPLDILQKYYKHLYDYGIEPISSAILVRGYSHMKWERYLLDELRDYYIKFKTSGVDSLSSAYFALHTLGNKILGDDVITRYLDLRKEIKDPFSAGYLILQTLENGGLSHLPGIKNIWIGYKNRGTESYPAALLAAKTYKMGDVTQELTQEIESIRRKIS
ncbi:MAG: ATP-binding protein [Nanoarchaeota archaeon]|nr:ATP-binding protein [Nanoarchaeota archaeon]